MHSDYTIEIVRSDEAFQALREPWQRLYEKSAPRNPFCSYEWAAACRAHVCRNASLYFVLARHGADPVGIAALRMERRGGLRVLRHIGAGWTEYTGFVTDAEHPRAERALMEALVARRADWDILLLRQLVDDYSGLHQMPAPKRFRSAAGTGEVAPYLRFEGGWAEQVASGPQQLRHSKRPARKWEKEGGTVERITGAACADCLDDLALVEASSWKGEDYIQRFCPGPDREFFRQILAEAGAREELEIWMARMEGKPAAFQINFVTPQKVWYWYGAYDEAYRKFYPGGVLHVRAIERARETGREEYDFMSGAEPYKFGWTNGVREPRTLALYPASLRGILAFALFVGPKWWLKELPHARELYRLIKILRGDPKLLLSPRALLQARAH